MFSVQISSDLHIEYKNDKVPSCLDFITPSADILILAGDIGSFYKIEQLKLFLIDVCSKFIGVLYIPGNQEWYEQPNHHPLSISVLEKRMEYLEKSISNLHILNRNSVRIGDICIVGATLWSYPKTKLPEFVRIHGMTTSKYLEYHKKDLEYIQKMIEYCQEKKIKMFVITHHTPTEKVLGSSSKDRYASYYCTNLEYLLDKNKVSTWVCGHTHKNFDFHTDNGCRVVSNQKGKPRDKVSDYQKNFVIKINK